MNPDTRLCRPLPKPFGHVASRHEDSGVLALAIALSQHGGSVFCLTPPSCPDRTFISRRRLAFLAGPVLILAAGCSRHNATDDGSGVTGCAAIVAEASLAREVDDQVTLLDSAIVACSSYVALTTELDRYPGITGYSTETFVSLRCINAVDDSVRRAATCTAFAVPTTTMSTPTEVELVFVGEALDGRTVEIRPDGNTQFVGDVPAVIQQTVDIAFESGCEGVTAQRDLWAAQVADPTIGDQASVYAKHAENVLIYIGCPATPG